MVARRDPPCGNEGFTVGIEDVEPLDAEDGRVAIERAGIAREAVALE